MIEPRRLKGFRDYLPAAAIPRERLIETARRVYRSYGFSPIDTPALEYLEILTGKGSEETDRQLYKFQDHGGRWVGMRFDLTVPLARFVAEHAGVLGTPFKRYHIGTVWRGENTQAGRYREFMQCDFDTIGATSVAADIEAALVIHDLFLALGFSEFTIHVNNRMVLTGLLEKLGLADRSTTILRSLDKLGKLTPEQVAAEMQSAAGLNAEQAAQVLRLAELRGPNDDVLRQLGPLVAGNETGETGVGKLAEVLSAARAVGVPEERLRLNVAIARGLDYYTGTIYETFINALPQRGSVCSGGRYDDLASTFTKERLPGIGASLGFDRLLSVMEELNLLPQAAATAEVFIPYFDVARLHDYLRLAAAVRSGTYRGADGQQLPLGAEIYPEPKKLGAQLKYADRRGFRVALIAGDREFAAGECQVKNLRSDGSATVSIAADWTALLGQVRAALEA